MSSNTQTSRPPIRVSRVDAERIESLLENPQYRALDSSALVDELSRAEILEPGQMPGDVIGMNSVARVKVTSKHSPGRPERSITTRDRASSKGT